MRISFKINTAYFLQFIYLFCAIILPYLHEGGFICAHDRTADSISESRPENSEGHEQPSDDGKHHKDVCSLCVMIISAQIDNGFEISESYIGIATPFGFFSAGIPYQKLKVYSNPSTAPPFIF